VFYDQYGPLVAVKQPGQARVIWAPERPGATVYPPVYDGRYLWLHCQRKLWVVDPIDEKSFPITHEHGLPVSARGAVEEERSGACEMRIAPLGPGQAIVVGWIGRTWLAHVSVDRGGDHKVRVFHEARETLSGFRSAPTSAGKEQWRNTHLTFRPLRAVTLAGADASGRPMQRVLIWRQLPQDVEIRRHPLVVDPQELSVAVIEERWDVARPEFRSSEAFYYTALSVDDLRKRGIRNRQLLRVGLPDLKPKVLLSGVPEGQLLIDGNTVHLVGQQWWRGKLDAGQFTSAGSVPWFDRRYHDLTKGAGRTGDRVELKFIARSNHYGIVLCGRQRGGPALLAQVLFDGSGLSIQQAINRRKEKEEEDSLARTSPPRPSTPRRLTPPREVLWRASPLRIVNGLAFSPDGKCIVTPSLDVSPKGSVQTWDAADGRLLAEAPGHDTWVVRLVFSRSGKYVATGDAKGVIMIWNADPLRLLHRLQAHDKEIASLAFSWDDRWLGSAGRDYRVFVWDPGTGKPVYQLPQESRRMRANWIAFTPDNKRILLGDQSGAFWYWDLASGRLAGRIETLKWASGFLPDKTLLGVAADSTSSLVAWDCNTDTYRRLWPSAKGIPVAVSADGRRVAVLQRDVFVDGRRTRFSRLRVFELQTQKKLLATPFDSRKCEAFSPDGRIFVVVDGHGQLWRWDLDQQATPAPATPESVEHQLGAFGQPVDPDGDCSFQIDDTMLTLTVPDTLHELTPDQSLMNAPRVLRRAHGDLLAEVKIEGRFQPAGSHIEGRPAHCSAGLLLFQDEQNYVRLERYVVRHSPGDSATSQAVLEIRQHGTIPKGGKLRALMPQHELRFLRLERRADKILALTSGDGFQWQYLPPRTVTLGPDLKVGVVATNNSSQPFAPRFSQFSVVQGK